MIHTYAGQSSFLLGREIRCGHLEDDFAPGFVSLFGTDRPLLRVVILRYISGDDDSMSYTTSNQVVVFHLSMTQTRCLQLTIGDCLEAMVHLRGSARSSFQTRPLACTPHLFPFSRLHSNAQSSPFHAVPIVFRPILAAHPSTIWTHLVHLISSQTVDACMLIPVVTPAACGPPPWWYRTRTKNM